jgi:hypothetical protein
VGNLSAVRPVSQKIGRKQRGHLKEQLQVIAY